MRCGRIAPHAVATPAWTSRALSSMPVPDTSSHPTLYARVPHMAEASEGSEAFRQSQSQSVLAIASGRTVSGEVEMG